ncbi:hypothetical protein [Marinigracilibium pacificum]|uniref:Uncharacterized protein n=1 Tax=Marinigracilibium pacificum TaxID=2729599 RepID=A0A848J7C3_9BACT|nr:hypothetical protein [Marinigracilibium pacificum]NMM50334.1 hypothetical protein [Marinigracilibium pacificum]
MKDKNETRKIYYIDPFEDSIDEEVKLAAQSTMEENLVRFFEVMTAQLAMQGINYRTHPVERTIFYINEENSK